MIRAIAATIALAFLPMVACAQASISVEVDGRVAHPGETALAGSPRLADIVKAAGVGREAYVLGAAWFRPALLDSQTRLKAGLVYELGEIRENAVADGREPLADLALRLRRWVSGMQVTGRQVVRTLEPHALQVSPSDNLPVKDGDRLVYPSRPHSVTVVGAVQGICELPQLGLKDARDYLAQCPLSAYANADEVFVIEPDGNVFKRGVALWNRDPAMPVAPGAVLYVPLRVSATLHSADAAFNQEMAEFLASQTLEFSGMKP